MTPEDFLSPRCIVLLEWPNSPYKVGDVLSLELYSCQTNELRIKGSDIDPLRYINHFRPLKWHEHRTIEQLLSIRYMKIIEGSNYYVTGDIVEVVSMFYNDPSYIGFKDKIGFSLKGHNFTASQLEPATKEEHDDFGEREKQKANK